MRVCGLTYGWPCSCVVHCRLSNEQRSAIAEYFRVFKVLARVCDRLPNLLDDCVNACMPVNLCTLKVLPSMYGTTVWLMPACTAYVTVYQSAWLPAWSCIWCGKITKHFFLLFVYMPVVRFTAILCRARRPTQPAPPSMRPRFTPTSGGQQAVRQAGR